jgi:superoxide dismutase
VADKLLGVCSGEPVGKHWAEHFVTYSAELKMASNQVKDRQRIPQFYENNYYRTTYSSKCRSSASTTIFDNHSLFLRLHPCLFLFLN